MRKHRPYPIQSIGALVLAICVFSASPVLAALASVGTIGIGSSTTSNTTLAITTTAQCDAGNICICAIAMDNTSAVDTNTSEVSTVADSALNTWTELRSFTNAQGGAALGSSLSIYKTRATSNLALGGTITVTFANTITSKSASCWEYTTGADIQIAAGGSGVGFLDNADDDAAEYPSMALATLPSAQRLYFRAMANESNASAGLTPTATFTQLTPTRADTGASGSSMGIRGEFLINTSTGETSAPTSGSQSRDSANIFLALEEIVAGTAAPTTRRRFQ